MKNTNETNTDTAAAPAKERTTFHTWGRVAQDHMERMSEVFANTAEMQQAALKHGRELFDHQMLVASEWQTWANETRRKVLGHFASK